MTEIANAGFFESILVSQISFFVLTLLDIYSIRKIKKNYAQLIHTISFFVISLMIVLILNSFITQYQILLSIEALIFIIMQFYTNFSFFASLKEFNEENIDLMLLKGAALSKLLYPDIVTRPMGDIDLLVIAKESDVDLKRYESALGRKINIIFEDSPKGIPKELLNNVINGIVLYGYLKVIE